MVYAYGSSHPPVITPIERLAEVNSALTCIQQPDVKEYWTQWLLQEQVGWHGAQVVGEILRLSIEKRKHILNSLSHFMQHVLPAPLCQNDASTISRIISFLNTICNDNEDRILCMTYLVVNEVGHVEWKSIGDFIICLCATLQRCDKNSEYVFDAVERLSLIIKGHSDEVSTSNLCTLISEILPIPICERKNVISACLAMIELHPHIFKRSDLWIFINTLRSTLPGDRSQIIHKILNMIKNPGMTREEIGEVLCKCCEQSMDDKRCEEIFSDSD